MASLDLGTVLLLHQSSLVAGAASLLHLWLRAGRPAGVLRIALGFALLSLGAALGGLNILEAALPDFATQSVLAVCLLGDILLLQGLQRLDSPLRWHWSLICAGLALVAFALTLDRTMEAALRSLVFHAAGAGILLVGGLSIAWRRRVEPLPSRGPLALCLFAGSAIYALQVAPDLLGWAPPISATTGFALLLTINYGLAAFVSSMVRERTELQHRRVAVTDSLTGTANRRGFFDLVPPEPRAGDGLAVLDLDRFKRLNDQFGHAAGDHALTAFAAIVERRLGHGEIFARFGGEEFVIFVPGPQASRAVRLVEEIRATLASEEIVWKGLRLPVTVSIGLSVAGTSATQWSVLQEGADRALYSAKAAGRNRVAIDLGIVPDEAGREETGRETAGPEGAAVRQASAA
ncbi:GGDEF domain-containing protein [Aurantimonas sp. Leaf443]|uniref:GGDEF domain-containing protein n=1 Tax=Aurantimonas sp. Leaf443 TaxID=1736378 RepID=UPI0006FE7455|nr:GGDEF domain-containing protein [Aurantimonas sp. Leaf443]KQT84087.1 hypothetical protein ASG48_12015 [Aurantimonas sp. Leaf443]